MTHKNRGRITVALGGAWRIYTTRIPATGRAIGTVVSNGETGALVYIERTGIYVRCNAGEVSSLPQSKVVAAVTKARATHGGVSYNYLRYIAEWQVMFGFKPDIAARVYVNLDAKKIAEKLK
jgi:hypothetical protein